MISKRAKRHGMLKVIIQPRFVNAVAFDRQVRGSLLHAWLNCLMPMAGGAILGSENLLPKGCLRLRKARFSAGQLFIEWSSLFRLQREEIVREHLDFVSAIRSEFAKVA